MENTPSPTTKSVKFTIQNVPIKLSLKNTSPDKGYNLQYKMFLLNLF